MTGYCYGCGRTNEEKKLWKNESTSNDWKEKNHHQNQQTKDGWQLETFKEPYEHKKNNGISLFKKNMSK